VETFCKTAGSGVHGKEGNAARMRIYQALRDLQVRPFGHFWGLLRPARIALPAGAGQLCRLALAAQHCLALQRWLPAVLQAFI